jgi:hypothetical protein
METYRGHFDLPLQTCSGRRRRILPGPVADALTHVGQIATLRHMAGCKIRGENYFAANIRPGAVGARQAPPVVEFD